MPRRRPPTKRSTNPAAARVSRRRKKQPSPDLAIASAILLGADTIARAVARLDYFGIVPPGFRLRCANRRSLSAVERGDGWAIDFEFGGKTRAEVKQQAIDEAEAAARTKVEQALDRQIARVRCESPCIRVPGNKTTRIIRPGRITGISPDTAGLFTRYDASAVAEGEVEVECRMPVGDIAPVP